MKSLIAFTKKEFQELWRTNKLLILIIIFILFGVMNPAIAKLTPQLMKLMEESLSDSGLTVTSVKVDAMTSWTQFYKNLPIAMIIFILMFSGTLTLEYQRGTLVNILTKGLPRANVILAKACAMFTVWTVGYLLCYGITYAYNAYFWDNSIASYPAFSAFCFYLIGVWLISLILLMSACFPSSSAVLLGTGGVFLLAYLLNFLPKTSKYLPAHLLSSQNLLVGISEPSEYLFAIFLTIFLSALSLLFSVLIFNRKAL